MIGRFDEVKIEARNFSPADIFSLAVSGESDQISASQRLALANFWRRRSRPSYLAIRYRKNDVRTIFSAKSIPCGPSIATETLWPKCSNSIRMVSAASYIIFNDQHLMLCVGISAAFRHRNCFHHSGRNNRNLNDKFRAQTFTRAERFDRSPMKFNQALSKCQSKPQAAVFSIKRRVSLSEGIEDPATTAQVQFPSPVLRILERHVHLACHESVQWSLCHLHW